MVGRIDQQGGVLKSEMGAGGPSAVGLNGKQSLIGPGLYPPRTALRKDYDFLSGVGSGDAAGNGVGAFAATLGGGRNFGEFDGELGLATRMTASQLDGDENCEENREGDGTRLVV